VVPPAAEIGFETVIPSAPPTVAALGQLCGAAVSTSVAIGPVVGTVVVAEVGAVVGAAVAAVDSAIAVALLEPQPPTTTPKTRAVAAIQRGLVCDMENLLIKRTRFQDQPEWLRQGLLPERPLGGD
jgi:hypothetical protein